MKIDNCIQQFVETYNEDQLRSIQEISDDRTYKITNTSINLFNLKESFEKFNTYLKGYSDYKIKNLTNPKASPQYAIKEAVNKFIDEDLFKESKVLYRDLNQFVIDYNEGVKSIIETIDIIKSDMMNNNVELESVGDVNDFTDKFISVMDEKFNESMDQILTLSGYKTQVMLNTPSVKKENPIFL